MHIPCTINTNTLQTYSSNDNKIFVKKNIRSENFEWDANIPNTLVLLCVKSIANNWDRYPVYREIFSITNRGYLTDLLDTKYSIERKTARIIKSDNFWKRAYSARWPISLSEGKNRPWLKVFMEKHIAEYIEKNNPSSCNAVEVAYIIKLCAPYVEVLKINQLLPSPQPKVEHIFLYTLFSGLVNLTEIHMTFGAKTIGDEFYYGCCNPSNTDINTMCRGLVKCNNLTIFNIYSTNLNNGRCAKLLKGLKKCHSLHTLYIMHCYIGDSGAKSIAEWLEPDMALKHLDLTNNKIGAIGCTAIAETLTKSTEFEEQFGQFPLESLTLRLNQISDEAATCLFSSLVKNTIMLKLDLSACLLSQNISDTICNFYSNNSNLEHLNLSNNSLGREFEEKLRKILPLNVRLQYLDLRTTDVSNEFIADINKHLLLHKKDKDEKPPKWRKLNFSKGVKQYCLFKSNTKLIETNERQSTNPSRRNSESHQSPTVEDLKKDNPEPLNIN